jgi:hypothetical protein
MQIRLLFKGTLSRDFREFCHELAFPLAFCRWDLHCKKWLAEFPSQAGMSLSKLSLAGNHLIIPGQGEFG